MKIPSKKTLLDDLENLNIKDGGTVSPDIETKKKDLPDREKAKSIILKYKNNLVHKGEIRRFDFGNGNKKDYFLIDSIKIENNKLFIADYKILKYFEDNKVLAKIREV